MTLADSIQAGMNNPDCSFYVGHMMGQASAGTLIFRVALVYFGIKLLDKLIFQMIPEFWRKRVKK